MYIGGVINVDVFIDDDHLLDIHMGGEVGHGDIFGFSGVTLLELHKRGETVGIRRDLQAGYVLLT